MKFTVYFHMWGQKCQTDFIASDELDPLTWLKTMYQKGWLDPIEIVDENGVVVTQKRWFDDVKEKWL